MKKQLLLLSALGMAGMASAQSSVTLFGILDATIAHGSGSIADRTQLSRGGYNTPRIGFRGVEDLGGGLSAHFWLEAGINNDDGTGGATNTNNQASGGALAGMNGSQGLTFARRSTVGIAGPWGEFRAGRDYTPQYGNLVAGDPFGNVGVGASINYTAAITGVTLVRASNMLEYFTPRMGGFTVHVAHYRGENASNTATEDDGTGNGIRLTYANGPLTAGLGYGRTEYAAGDVVQSNVNAGWDFKVAKIVGTFSKDENGATEAKGGSIGASAPVGAGEVKAAWSVYKITAAGTEREGKKLALGYVHNLSKRTAVYGTFAQVKNSGGANFALNGASTAANTTSRGFDLGIRHSF